jgi:translation initiation factor IF-2
MKAHELSKILELQFKELKEIASNLSISINSPNQKLTDEQISLIEEFLNKRKDKNEAKVNESPSIKEVSIKEPSIKKTTETELMDAKLEVIEKESIDKKFDEKEKVLGSRSFQETRSAEKDQDIVKKEEVKVDYSEESIKEVEVEFPITVEKFANTLNINLTELIQKLLSKGHILNKNSFIDFSLAEEIAFEYNILIKSKEKEKKSFVSLELEEQEIWVSRPPVVTVMGHVDHGKTTLLDTIRKTNVVSKEAGGITQHIGAYQVEYNSKKITFIDTPGHEAFTSLRARGAKVTDIVILVVAADDGVMPQTIEAINHAKAAGVPIIVAINKIDKPNANVDRVKNQLVTYGLIPEEWGGHTPVVEISAKTGKNIDYLLEVILLVAELMDLKANIAGNPEGVVIESKLDKNKGPIATILVQKGILKTGMSFVIGKTWGKIRAMYNERGQIVKEATPSTPVEIIGISQVPEAGEKLIVVENEKIAKNLALENQKLEEISKKQSKKVFSINDILAKFSSEETQNFNIILKADTQGSLEAIKSIIERMNIENIRFNILHAAVGNIVDSDVLLAKASNAVILGFNIKVEATAKKLIEKEGIQCYIHNIIYELIDNLKKLVEGAIKPEEIEIEIGQAQVKQVFKVKNGKVAGCYVINGKITRDSKVIIERNNGKVFEGYVESLRRFQEDVKEVNQGYECGIKIKDFNDILVGDIIRAFVKQYQ